MYLICLFMYFFYFVEKLLEFFLGWGGLLWDEGCGVGMVGVGLKRLFVLNILVVVLDWGCGWVWEVVDRSGVVGVVVGEEGIWGESIGEGMMVWYVCIGSCLIIDLGVCYFFWWILVLRMRRVYMIVSVIRGLMMRMSRVLKNGLVLLVGVMVI